MFIEQHALDAITLASNSAGITDLDLSTLKNKKQNVDYSKFI